MDVYIIDASIYRTPWPNGRSLRRNRLMRIVPEYVVYVNVKGTVNLPRGFRHYRSPRQSVARLAGTIWALPVV